MPEQPVLGENLTSKQEAELLFYYDEDSNLWLYLLADYIHSHGKNSEMLKAGIVNNTEEWQGIVSQAKSRGFEDLKELACDRVLQWNLRIKQMFMDAGHVNLFGFYLRSLINLKTKKVAAIGGRGKIQQQINAIVSYLANNAFSYLGRYVETSQRLKVGKTSSGRDLAPEALTYYQQAQSEALKEVTYLLGLLVTFKCAKNNDDIQKVQNLVRVHMLKPLEVKARTVKGDEQKEIKVKIDAYYKLLQALDISF